LDDQYAAEEDDSAKYVGQVIQKHGVAKFSVKCDDIMSMHGANVKILRESRPPFGLKVGDWVSFCMKEDGGEPLALDIEVTDAPGDELAIDNEYA